MVWAAAAATQMRRRMALRIAISIALFEVHG
jgi:hypothetical protein